NLLINRVRKVRGCKTGYSHKGQQHCGWRNPSWDKSARHLASVANSPPLLLISSTMADVATPTKSFLSGKVAHFTESVIREMTRKAMMYDAVNLAQGFPDFPAPA